MLKARTMTLTRQLEVWSTYPNWLRQELDIIRHDVVADKYGSGLFGPTSTLASSFSQRKFRLLRVCKGPNRLMKLAKHNKTCSSSSVPPCTPSWLYHSHMVLSPTPLAPHQTRPPRMNAPWTSFRGVTGLPPQSSHRLFWKKVPPKWNKQGVHEFWVMIVCGYPSIIWWFP